MAAGKAAGPRSGCGALPCAAQSGFYSFLRRGCLAVTRPSRAPPATILPQIGRVCQWKGRDRVRLEKLRVHLRGWGGRAVLAPLFKMFEACLELLVPLVMARIIDVGIAGRDGGAVLRMGGVLVALGAAGLAASVTAQYFAARVATGFTRSMRLALFSKIQSLDYAGLDEAGVSTLITRMTSDANQVQNGVNLTLRLLLRSPFVVVGAMLMAFTIDTRAAVIFVVIIPLLALAVGGIMALTMPLYKKVQARLDTVLLTTRENLAGVRVLRAFNKQPEEAARFAAQNGGLTREQLFVGRISALMNPLTSLLVNGAVLVLLWTGAVQVDTGRLSQGQVVALVNYMSQILVELVKLANLIVTVARALACAGRIETVLELEPSMQKGGADGGNETDAPAAAEGGQSAPDAGQSTPAAGPAAGENGQEAPDAGASVVFEKVCARYRGASGEALTDLSFAAAPGQTIGVIGGTGSGKSTLVNLIPRFYDVSAGRVLVDGRDVRAWPLDELRAMIGVVPQKAVLFAGSIRQNLCWGDENADDAALWAALKTAQAAEVVRGKEGGLDARIEQGGRNLSGGQRQRLTIARALVRRPRILILDDSASALDFATDAALRKALRQLPFAPTTFVVSQRAASVMHADTIIVLEDGAVADIGPHEALLQRCAVYREIYDSQFGGSEPVETAKEAAQNG